MRFKNGDLQCRTRLCLPLRYLVGRALPVPKGSIFTPESCGSSGLPNSATASFAFSKALAVFSGKGWGRSNARWNRSTRGVGSLFGGPAGLTGMVNWEDKI
jgi:hypothetical protein